MFKNIIFDFDGVIINSHDVQKKALEESYRKIVGKGEPPYNEFFLLSGDSLENIFVKLGLPLTMLPIYVEVSRNNVESIKIQKGMIELLQELNSNGYNCALCTGKERKRTIEILKYHKLERYFKFVVCSDDVKNAKPHPDSLQLIMKKLKASSSNSVMIGDGINDILVAKNAGIKSIAVTWGDVPEKELQKYDSEYMVTKAEDIRKIIFDM